MYIAFGYEIKYFHQVHLLHVSPTEIECRNIGGVLDLSHLKYLMGNLINGRYRGPGSDETRI